MKKQKPINPTRILLIIVITLVSIPLMVVALFAASYLITKINQISKTEADQKCYKFVKEVKADISSVQGFTVVAEDISCTPNQDEAGFTDYQFMASFKVIKDDNLSAESQKANINFLAKSIPISNFAISVANIPLADGKSPAICVSALTLIQEDGSTYLSIPAGNTADYTEPDKILEYPPCRNIQ